MDTQRNFSVQRLATAVEQVPSSTMELLLSMYNVNRDKLNSSLLQTKNEQQRLSSASPSSIAAAVAAVSALSSASPSLAPDPPGFIGPFQISSLLANGTFPASSSILGVNASHGSSQPPSFDPWSYPFVVTSPPLGQTTDSGPVLRGLISSEGNQGMSVGASASASASHTGLGCDQDSSQDKKGHPGKEDSISCVVAKKKKKKKWTRPGRTGSFPQKLHKMLRDLEENGKQGKPDLSSSFVFLCCSDQYGEA